MKKEIEQFPWLPMRKGYTEKEVLGDYFVY